MEPVSESHIGAARQRQATLTKPARSLGRLEDIACQIAGIQCKSAPKIEHKWVVVAAGDHGVVAEDISAFPQTVTAQMVANFLNEGAAVSVLARQVNAKVKIVDAGVANPIPGDVSRLIDLKLADGTANFTLGPAMTRDHAIEIVSRGIDLASELANEGADLVAVGEMGIGNTTSASAITSVMLDAPPKTVTGHGTGIDEVARLRKAFIVQKAISINNPDPDDPIDVLSRVGGYEIGLLVGVILGSAREKIAVVIDGFISTSAALLAAAISPAATQYMIASHRSVEPGHILALEHLGLKPAIDLDMRLGEASGAVLAMPIIESAVRLHNEMVTFEEAQISGGNRTSGGVTTSAEAPSIGTTPHSDPTASLNSVVPPGHPASARR
ncbi:MAG: nicotinate-nucleotide--dimethylbenzimidazole phosphoribosyltransferase [Chloroflexi bacterium]|nr:nicotinate-nucleotide--dimethylbenzimidazole phosphoribosyltransferase [Chloroflexota bacterium]